MSKYLYCLVLGLSLVSIPVLAEQANFATLTLVQGFDSAKAYVIGYTGGNFSLSDLAKEDLHNHPCIGYGDVNPDHILILKNDFAKLGLMVNSEGEKTTLLIRNKKNKTIYCGMGNSSNKDAQIQDVNWSAGEYEVWIGTIEPGKRITYRLVAISAN
jgi:hypothetical protein